SISAGVSAVVDSLAWGITNVMSFAGWLASGSTGADTFTIAVGALAGGFLAYQGIMGGVALWTGIVTSAQWLWNLALTANPIGIVVVAIGALIGGLAIAYMKFAGFRAMIDGVWGVMKDIGALF
ncbi:hypothetical protein, partial [Flavobacterium sp. UBA6046]|uniref:hypothetical protein n=1 Tax=Flavobacterium sp. UBA6046 TaxID=1946552 RepID=UPI0025BC182E